MAPKITRNDPFGLVLEPQGPDDDIRSLDIELVRELLWKERLIVLRGFRTFSSAEEFSDYCERWGEVSIWPFGKVLELKERPNPEDHIFDNNYVPLHWDGMYRPQVPAHRLIHDEGRVHLDPVLVLLDEVPVELESYGIAGGGGFDGAVGHGKPAAQVGRPNDQPHHRHHQQDPLHAAGDVRDGAGYTWSANGLAPGLLVRVA